MSSCQKRPTIRTCNQRGERMQQMMQRMMKNMPMMRDGMGNGHMDGMRNMMGGE